MYRCRVGLGLGVSNVQMWVMCCWPSLEQGDVVTDGWRQNANVTYQWLGSNITATPTNTPDSTESHQHTLLHTALSNLNSSQIFTCLFRQLHTGANIFVHINTTLMLQYFPFDSEPFDFQVTTLYWASCSHIYLPVSPSSMIWHQSMGTAAGKVTVGLASHWPCVTDFSGLSSYRLTAQTGRWAPRLCCLVEYDPFTYL